MNKFLLIICFLLFLLVLFSTKKTKKPIKFESGDLVVSSVVEDINFKLNKVKKIYLNLEIKCGLLSAKGFMAYEKPNNFRMICESLFSKEVEIGSNEKEFWFFSKNLRPKALYYCDFKLINKTRLKKLFYPDLIKSFLGLDLIKNYEIREYENGYCAIEKINLSNEPFYKITVIENNKIVGCKICDNNNKVLLETKILEFQEIKNLFLPKKIKIICYEESTTQDWELSEINLNSEFSNWDMPTNYKNKINLVDY